MGNFFSKIKTYPAIFNVCDRDELEELLLYTDIDLVHNNETALTHACMNENTSVVKMFLLYGANPNPVLDDSNTTFYETQPKLTDDMLELLACWGYPNENFDIEKMKDEVKVCLEKWDDQSIFNSFIRNDEKDILSDAEMYDYIRKNLSEKHAYVWMSHNNFKLHYVEN